MPIQITTPAEHSPFLTHEDNMNDMYVNLIVQLFTGAMLQKKFHELSTDNEKYIKYPAKEYFMTKKAMMDSVRAIEGVGWIVKFKKIKYKNEYYNFLIVNIC